MGFNFSTGLIFLFFVFFSYFFHFLFLFFLVETVNLNHQIFFVFLYSVFLLFFLLVKIFVLVKSLQFYCSSSSLPPSFSRSYFSSSLSDLSPYSSSPSSFSSASSSLFFFLKRFITCFIYDGVAGKSESPSWMGISLIFFHYRLLKNQIFLKNSFKPWTSAAIVRRTNTAIVVLSRRITPRSLIFHQYCSTTHSIFGVHIGFDRNDWLTDEYVATNLTYPIFGLHSYTPTYFITASKPYILLPNNSKVTENPPHNFIISLPHL